MRRTVIASLKIMIILNVLQANHTREHNIFWYIGMYTDKLIFIYNILPVQSAFR